MENKLKELIDSSGNILITSHVSPDPDSICSILLLGLTLEANFPDKKINMVCEEMVDNLNFLPGYEKIKSQPLAESVDAKDLIILVDAMNFARCTRGDASTISQKVKDGNIAVVIIDHHEAVEVEENKLYINDKYPAAAEQVYKTCFKDLGLKKPDGYAEITMAGLYSDTGSFTFLNDNFKETLGLVSELLDASVKIEDIKTKLYQYSESQIKVVAELANNISHDDSYTYSYLSDDFVADWLASGKDLPTMHTATKIFIDNFIRNIDGRLWGFIFYKNPHLGPNIYSVSFRSVGGHPNVSALAAKISGGGHKGAAGARVEANSLQEAKQKIQKVISDTI
jgi:bifunctional oligoribonuclease and PAP phosphatase NrnA